MPTLIASDETKLEVSQEEFNGFREWLKVEKDIENRISKLFWLDLYVGYRLSNLNCNSVLDAIRNLEKSEPETGVKRATPFNRPPLKGLWHKHYYSGTHLPMNVANQLNDSEFIEITERLKQENIRPEDRKRRYLGEAMKLVQSSLADRSANQKLTGEWIIFKKRKLGNLYLCLGYHEMALASKKRDQFLIDRMVIPPEIKGVFE